MTFGEKLKEYRKKQGLSQEQLANRLCVSRQAITKWEADRGLPEISNLVEISRLLEISMDSLLGNPTSNDDMPMKEKIELKDYKKSGNCRSIYDAVVKEKYSSATIIYPLIRQKKLNKKEAILDFIVQPGVFQVADVLNDMSAYYLVEMKNQKLLVNVTKTYIEAKIVTVPFEGKKCIIEQNIFKKMPYTL